MKLWTICIMALCCTGCTMMSLERHAVAQSDSAVEVRYQEVLDNLARIAHDPSALPSYASIFSGTIFVQDQGQVVSSNVLPYISSNKGLAALNPSIQRQISQNWVLDPISAPEKLEALRAACQWAIGGPEHVTPYSMSLLIRPDQAPAGSDRHFSVADDLARLPAGWLGIGKHKDIP